MRIAFASQLSGADLRLRLRELAQVFTRLGFTAFGGPAVHIAMMEEQCVTKRGWLDRQHFLDLVAAVNFIPGPNSTELAIHIGLIRAGFFGMLVAGFCFITPAVLIILPIAWLYVRFGTLPQMQPAMRGIGAAVVAVVFMAMIRLIKPIARDPFEITFAILALIAALLMGRAPWLQPELLILAVAALVGALRAGARVAMPMLSIGVLGAGAIFPSQFAQMALFFLKVGATLFGSGYVLVSYLQTGLVDGHHWLTQQQLLDAIAVGQFTPGPLFTTATFVGYLLGADRFGGGLRGGIGGAVVATVAIFLPSFVLILALAPVLNRVRHHPAARGALNGMNAAVIGLLAAVALRLAASAILRPGTHSLDPTAILILLAAITALLRNINSTWIIVAAGAIGWVLGTKS